MRSYPRSRRLLAGAFDWLASVETNEEAMALFAGGTGSGDGMRAGRACVRVLRKIEFWQRDNSSAPTARDGGPKRRGQ
jgi:hypothetical protein